MAKVRSTVDQPATRATRAARHRKSRHTAWISLGVLFVCGVLVTLGIQVFSGGGNHPVTTPAPTGQSNVRTAPLMRNGQPYRAFKDNSWWNAPVPSNAPHNPNETAILDYLGSAPENGGGCLRLAGAGSNPWGQPVYWAQPGDQEYAVHGLPDGAPPELQQLRVPPDAEAAQNTDGTMTVYDLDKGYVALLTDAHYNAATGEWSASGGTVTYVHSNGLIVTTGRSDNKHNTGTHRGNNGATSVARYDMVAAGAIDNVLKVAAGPELANRAVFPMTGSDGDYTGNDPAVPPEGLRLRIKPSINLDNLGLHPQALVIAKAIQKYGIYLGDSGGTTALKLEDTKAEGRGQLWDVTSQDLCGLPFSSSYWDVLPEGYDPSAQ